MVLEIGLEQIQSQHAGGMLLPPVQKLVATLIKSRDCCLHLYQAIQTVVNQENVWYTNNTLCCRKWGNYPMETNDYLILIWGMIAGFLWGQLEASGNIGNRSYSIWYQTHFLVEKRGICNLIYYQPKHFARYTLYGLSSKIKSWIFLSPKWLFNVATCSSVKLSKAKETENWRYV